VVRRRLAGHPIRKHWFEPMKLIARFIMRGFSQAALVTTVGALLSLMVPLTGPISSAAVGLVTLRNGTRAGLTLLALATLATSLISALALGTSWLGLGFLAVLWVPVWGLASVLRATRSLGLTVQLAALGGLVMVATFHLLVGDPGPFWHRMLEPLRESLVTDGLMDAAGSQVPFDRLASWMTGFFAAALVFQYQASLLIARWWQAYLYNPGGFGEEFRALRLGRVVGALLLALLVWAALISRKGLALDFLPVLGVLLVLHGLAVAHRVRQLLGVQRGWLVGLYVLLVLFMPQTGFLLAAIGLVDIWADVRARVARRVSRRR
jgi:hypothetical protein